MRSLKIWRNTFLCLGCIGLILLVLNFFLISPAWDGFLSVPMRYTVFCLAVVFFTASIILGVVKGVMAETTKK